MTPSNVRLSPVLKTRAILELFPTGWLGARSVRSQ